MNGALTGGIIGGVLAIVGLMFGFWGFLLVVVLGAIGAVIGAIASGRLDVRAVADAARGRSRA